MTGPQPLRILCVCSHNRSRSVLMHGLLQHHLHQVGQAAEVRSAGTRANGGPVSQEAVALLAPLGIDMSTHRGRPLDDDLVTGSDLIVTAERDHVVHIASLWPHQFARTFTLPEIVNRSRRFGGRLGGPADDWTALLNTARPTGAMYLHDDGIDDVADPTGHGTREWTAAWERLQHLTQALARDCT